MFMSEKPNEQFLLQTVKYLTVLVLCRLMHCQNWILQSTILHELQPQTHTLPPLLCSGKTQDSMHISHTLFPVHEGLGFLVPCHLVFS